MYITVGRVCNFLSSVLLQQKFEATDRPVLQLSFICKQRKVHPRGARLGRSKRRREERPPAQFWLLFLYVLSPPSGRALCKLSQPGGLFVLPEVLTPVLRPSFVLFSQAFPFFQPLPFWTPFPYSSYLTEKYNFILNFDDSMTSILFQINKH